MKIKKIKVIFLVTTLALIVVTGKFFYSSKHTHDHKSHSSSSDHEHEEKDQIDHVFEEISSTDDTQNLEDLPLAYQADQLIQSGDLKLFKQTILKRPNIKNTINEFSPEDGRTLLTRASFGAPLSYIKFIVEELGADVNVADKDKITPLMEAAASENLDVVKYLIDKKADINIQNKLGADSLTIALASGEPSLALILLENGADPNHKWNKKNFTHLMNAARNGHQEIVNLLIRYSAVINEQDNQGNTALHYASSQGFTDIVKNLLKSGADKNITNLKNKTPINLAKETGNTSTEQALK